MAEAADSGATSAPVPASPGPSVADAVGALKIAFPEVDDGMISDAVKATLDAAGKVDLNAAKELMSAIAR
jgi:hypothetical protein